MSVDSLLLLFLIGLIVGWLAGVVTKGRPAGLPAISSSVSGVRLWMDSFLARWGLGVSGLLASSIVASVGAIVMICIWRTLTRVAANMDLRIHKELRLARIALIVPIAATALSACSPLSVLMPSTQTGNTATPTIMPPPTIAPIVTATPSPPPTATATTRTVTTSGRAKPTPTTLPGVFVTAVKIDPIAPRSNQDPRFIVTFLNTTGQAKPYRWFVKIYTPDQSPSFGETTRIDTDIPTKTSQLESGGGWKTQTYFDCLAFIARVFWVDQDHQVSEFLKPDGRSPATGFSVCP